MDNQAQKWGLLKTKNSRKDYSRHKTFGSPDISQLPDEFLLISPILDQGMSEKCSAYSTNAVRASMTGKNYDPDWYWTQETILLGDPNAQGADLRTAMTVGITNGFMPLGSNDLALALQEKATAYYQVDGPFDFFDNARIAMFQQHKPVEGGTDWDNSWTNAPGGVIPTSSESPLGGHALKTAGWKKINGIPYIVLQNSWGMGRGDNGLYYVSREVYNNYFAPYLAYYFSDNKDPNTKTVGLLQSILSQISLILNIMRKSIGF